MVFSDVPKLSLYPADETQLLPQVFNRMQSASDGALTDFSPGSPLATIAEGQVWATLELLWYLNKLPEALALEVMRLAGVTRSLGNRTTGKLTFLLTAPQSSPFSLPVNYLVPYAPQGAQGITGTSGYLLAEPLFIPAGSVEAEVAVQAAQRGSAYNRPAFGVSITNLGLAFVQAVYNREALTGGSDLEPLEETVRRSQVALRDRKVLVSASDYERRTQELLGNGSRAFCVPLLSSDRETSKPGHVHVFAMTPERTRPSLATCSFLQSELAKVSFAGSTTWVSPVDLVELRVDLTVEVPVLSQATANAIADSIRGYLDPFSFTLGGTVRLAEVIYAARRTEGVLTVADCLIMNAPLNYAMPLRYSFPVLGALSVTQVDPNGFTQTYTVGSGLLDPD